MPARSIGKEISYIARSLNRYLDAKTRHLNLSSATVPFLAYLCMHDGVYQDEMAADLHFDKSSVTRAITALEKRGYVNRLVDPRIKRRNLITVTEAGLSLKDELIQILSQTTERLFAGFSPEEREVYFQSTEKINQNIKLMLSD
jgi:DNA-binding MarR family transcriptional regulator